VRIINVFIIIITLGFGRYISEEEKVNEENRSRERILIRVVGLQKNRRAKAPGAAEWQLK